MAKYLLVLRNRSFTLLMTSRAVSSLGDRVFAVAVMWYVLGHGRSVLAVSVIPAVEIVVGILGGIALAPFADRYPRRRVMVAADWLRTVGLLVVAGARWFHLGGSLVVFYAAMVLIELAGSIFGAAFSALLPTVLSSGDLLVIGQGMLSALLQILAVSGYAAGAAVVMALGIRGSVLADAISFFAGGSLLLLLRLGGAVHQSAAARDDEGPILRWWRQTTQGMKVVWADRRLRWVSVYGAILNTLAAPMAMFAALFTKYIAHAGVMWLGVVNSGWWLGAASGGILAGITGRRIRPDRLILTGTAVVGGLLFTSIMSGRLMMATATTLVFGVVGALINVPLSAALARLLPDEVRSRGLQAVYTMAGIGQPVGLILGGVVGGGVGVRSLYMAVSGVMLCAGPALIGFAIVRESIVGAWRAGIIENIGNT